MSAIDKIKQSLAIKEVIEHKDQPTSLKEISLIETGIQGEMVSKLLKMKSGILTTMTLALDFVDDSDCLIRLRLLSADEILRIEQEMADSKLIYGTLSYKIRHSAKRIALASTRIATDNEINKVDSLTLTESELLKIASVEVLTALDTKYLQFMDKYSPKLEELSQEQVDEVIEELVMMDEHQLGKSEDLLNGLSYQQMREIILGYNKKLVAVKKLQVV